MIQLAKFKYNADDTLSLDEKQPFNCYCVKEVWTMIKLLIDDLKPEDVRGDYYNMLYRTHILSLIVFYN